MLHSNIAEGDMHFIQQWTVADTTARDALSVAAADVGKVCEVGAAGATKTFYVLADDSPMTWTEIGGSGGAGTVTSVTSANADATVATTTTTPVITIVQAPALRSATTTVDVSAATAPTSGQVLTATSGTAATWQTPAAGGGITLGTPTTLTTQTSVDYTTIPAGTKRITLYFSSVSTTGTSNPLIQLGDSGGVETSSYVGCSSFQGTSSVGGSAYTTGFGVNSGNAANVLSGSIILSLMDSSTNTWTCFGQVANSTSGFTVITSGVKSLSAELDRVRFTTVNGTDQYDAGSVNISYES